MPDPYRQHQEYRHRIIKRSTAWGGGIILCTYFILHVSGVLHGVFDSRPSQRDLSQGRRTPQSTFLSQIGRRKDTLYTKKADYLVVDLDSQKLYHYNVQNPVEIYNVSTGNSNLPKGIETRTGIFLIQQKMDSLRSQQFGNTKVLNWLGFNWGVGFHSLETKGYYRNLGKRPTSHGCIRLSQEDAEKLYSKVGLGTPVAVCSGEPARIVAFLPGDAECDTLSLPPVEILSMLQSRLRDLYKGRLIAHKYPMTILDKKFVRHDGLPVGSGAAIPSGQIVPKWSSMFSVSERDLTGLHHFRRERP
jgi:hypothetical protein